MENLAHFKQTYFDESAELLGVAEAGLLRLAPDAVDMDEVNAVFRAVHSIKGGGGAFGFHRLVEFAHNFEAVMDGVRSERIAVTTNLVDLLIRANDVLAQLVALAKDETPAPADLGQQVLVELERWATATTAEPPAPASPAASSAPPPAGASPTTAAPATAPDAPNAAVTYCIQFHPRADLLQRGNEPTHMLRALARLGVVTVACETRDLPPLAQIDPERLYLSWTIRLATTAGVEQIDDVFEFVSDDSVVAITRETAVGPRTDLVGGTTPPASGAVGGAAGAALAVTPTPGRGLSTTLDVRDEPEPPRSRSAGEGGMVPTLAGHTIRVDLEKIDRLVNMVGEMVITQAMVAEHLRDLPPGQFQELLEGLEQLAQHTRELRESVMSIRAQPVASVFSRMPRLVRELSHETGKDVRLLMSGENTEVDKTVIENLVDPITHMIRNCIDHGIERPDDRERLGKPRTGSVFLSAQHRSGRIVIEVADDGRGLDRQRILAKAVERGLLPAGAKPSDEEIDNLIFLPGFSTADSVTNISGRGVGMDVVRRNITALGGRIGIVSSPGEGSRFILSLPLTLAVLDGMVISVGAERFVLPLTNIVESVRPRRADIHTMAHRCDVIMARGQYVRLVYLHGLFGIPGAVVDATRGLVVLVETESGDRLGLVVDEVLGQQQVVIKSLESNFRRLDGVAAATILGDGRVALILDVAGLQDMSRRSVAANFGRAMPEPSRSQEALEIGA